MQRCIARQLVLTEKTVETHIASVLTKLDLTETADDQRRVPAVLPGSKDASGRPLAQRLDGNIGCTSRVHELQTAHACRDSGRVDDLDVR